DGEETRVLPTGSDDALRMRHEHATIPRVVALVRIEEPEQCFAGPGDGFEDPVGDRSRLREQGRRARRRGGRLATVPGAQAGEGVRTEGDRVLAALAELSVIVSRAGASRQ